MAKSLAELEPRGWFVFHSARRSSGADIDHVVIGPSGVFTADTKHHRRAQMWIGDTKAVINGGKADYPPKARGEADRAVKILSTACAFDIRVRPVLAFVKAARIIDAPTR